ncbi:hypothetical protein PR202_ga13826 [Eleusine coracana subsp. coracana]|uniref:Uncharacterized protein n=1 Tax=Eleusine coracana subsp. coracana TaxID=191504 RepID=A0AAV5CFS0_ELECO|nr:hypothetical protein PR202_ga13826 [Eleusine coracana subsp. coracana]
MAILATASPPLTLRRWKPLLAAHPGANSPPALRRLVAPAASPLQTSPVHRGSCAGAAVERNWCAAAAASGGVKAEGQGDGGARFGCPEAGGGCCSRWLLLRLRRRCRARLRRARGQRRRTRSRRPGSGCGWQPRCGGSGGPTTPVPSCSRSRDAAGDRAAGGAIPVGGYWMRLHPVRLTVLAILGNMVPVPFIILYLKKIATCLSQRSTSATRIMELFFERVRHKAAPVEEFQWLGLMLFVAVPFPGTGAWTGAIIASVLGMPFWSGFSANFAGVVLAGLLVNLLMNLGLKYAIVTGIILFFLSSVMWGVLRSLKKSLNA